jgi:hypothetical protein
VRNNASRNLVSPLASKPSRSPRLAPRQCHIGPDVLFPDPPVPAALLGRQGAVRDELANPFEEAMRAVVWRHMDEGVGEAAWELAWAARDAMFSKP